MSSKLNRSLKASVLALAFTSSLTGCYISDPSAGEVAPRPPTAGAACTASDEPRGTLECADGVWVDSTSTSPSPDPSDMGSDTPAPTQDMHASPTDMTQSVDMEGPCVPESDAQLCGLAVGVECGVATFVDSCRRTRQISCGACADGDCVANVCESSCEAETNEELCLEASAQCGALEVTDACGTTRTIDCGACSSSAELCAQNQCECQPESDVVFCGRQGAVCGEVTTADNCGDTRTVQCGTCDDGACQPDNTCPACQPLSDVALCASEGRACGELVTTDNCGQSRTVECGACTTGRVCSISGSCECPTPVCSAGQECGEISNQCGNVTSCGTCNQGDVCENNTCICTPESNAQLCLVHNAACGSITVTDLCGGSRTIDCGGCPTNSMCENNSCACIPESNLELCTAAGSECGLTTVTDRCGSVRSVDCGTCQGINNNCNLSNQCVCVGESDAQLCAREFAECGFLSTTDRCGNQRLVNNCGNCPNNECCNIDDRVCLSNGGPGQICAL